MNLNRLHIYKHTVSQNFLSLTMWNVLLIGLPFLTIPYLIRVIGPERYGLIVFAQAFIQYFAFLLDYGFNYSSVREISIHRKDLAKTSSIFSAVITIKIFFLLIIFFIVLLTCFSFSRFNKDLPLYLATFISLIGYALSPTFLFMGRVQLKPILYFSIPTLITSLLIFIFVRSDKDFMLVPLLNGIGSLVSAQASLWYARTKMHIKWSTPKSKQLIVELKEGFLMFLSNIMAVGHANIRIFLVGILAGNLVTAYYVIGERLMSIMITFPLGLAVQAIYPRLCHVFLKDRDKIKSLIGQLQKITNITYFTTCVIAFIAAPTITTLMCGAPSYIATTSFRLLIVSVILTAINAFYIQWLMAAGMIKTVAKIGIIAGVFGTIFVYPLTAIWSYKGAACSVIIILLIGFYMTWMERKKL